MSTIEPADPETIRYFEDKAKKAEPYLLALGRFVSTFSQVEMMLQHVLWKFSKTAEPTAQAVFSGVRPETAMQFITRIAAAQKWKAKRKEEIEYVFSQLGMINKLRNDLLHYGASMEDELTDTWLITNARFVHIPERIQELRITPQLLLDAQADLAQILIRLIFLAWSRNMPTETRAVFRELREGAWRYKPPQRDQPVRKKQNKHQERKRQPPSSPK